MTIKIAQVITRMVPGGASKVVRQIIDGLGDKYKFDLITGPEQFPENLTAEQLPLNSIKIINSLIRDIHPWKDMVTLWELRTILKERDYDIVHTHTSKAGFLGRIAAGSLFDGQKVIHSPHGLIYQPDSQIPGVPADSFGRGVLLNLEKWAARYQDLYTTLSKHEEKAAVSLGLAEENETRVIYNGIEPDNFTADEEKRSYWRKKLGFNNSRLLFLTAGRLSEEKGHKILISAFKKLIQKSPDSRLLIAGEGPLKQELIARAEGLVAENKIVFTGYVEEMEELYSAADIFVLPSIYEGFGLVAVEAMSAGLPVVASRVGGVPEIIESGKQGYLVQPGAPEKLFKKMRKIAREEQKIEQFKQRARQRAEKFSREKMINKYNRVFEEFRKYQDR